MAKAVGPSSWKEWLNRLGFISEGDYKRHVIAMTSTKWQVTCEGQRESTCLLSLPKYELEGIQRS